MIFTRNSKHNDVNHQFLEVRAFAKFGQEWFAVGAAPPCLPESG